MQREIEALLNAWLIRQEQENQLVQGLLSALAQNEVARHKLLHDLSGIAALAIQAASGEEAAPAANGAAHAHAHAGSGTDERLTQAVQIFRAAQGASQRH